ncbi:hypothetical protein [Kamptonema formosum]|uniref:hypothetical protein n=1 Tax=Kamptonema formosum TaxID=331992 RepID=UPI00034D8B08|nr:hypothetical protein [Oscillatoria sp. PCC 10802]
MNDDPILKPVQKIVSLHDGLAEYSRPNTLSVLLSEEVAKTLEVEEEVTFTTSADVRDGYFVTYNSEIFNRFELLLGEKGYVATFAVQYQGYLKTTGFDKLLASALTPQNGLMRFIEAKPAVTNYLLCNVVYTASADEKRLGMVSFFVNELTGAAPVDIGDALLWPADRIPSEEGSRQHCLPFDTLSEIIENASEQLIDRDMEKWQKSLQRKLLRDKERLKAYYGTIAQEIRAKIKKKHLAGEEEERELARIAATELELERKQADILARYAVSVGAHLHSALVIQLPTVHIQCELVRKKHRRVVTAVWNPFSKQIEPLRCEVSHVPVYSFYLSDDEGNILSPACMQKGMKN